MIISFNKKIELTCSGTAWRFVVLEGFVDDLEILVDVGLLQHEGQGRLNECVKFCNNSICACYALEALCI